MSEYELTRLGNLFLALSDQTRLRLIQLMADETVSVGFLAESIGESQPKVSRHLAYLRNVDLVSTERIGKNVFYGIQWPEDPVALKVMTAVAGLIVEKKKQVTTTEDVRADTSAEAYINDYVSQEIEIFLL